MSNKIDEYISAVELAKALSISKGTVYGLCRQGILPEGMKLGRSRRWRVVDVQKALEGKKGA